MSTSQLSYETVVQMRRELLSRLSREDTVHAKDTIAMAIGKLEDAREHKNKPEAIAESIINAEFWLSKL